MADINKLIEQFAAGVKSSTREDVTSGNLEGFKDFNLSAKPATPRKTTTPTVTPLEAAQAVREAVAAKGGRRPKVTYWKPVAAKTLGISKLFAKRWQAVLDAGIDAGLFRIDTETLAHPILVALDPEPEPEVEEPVAVTRPRVVEDNDDFDYDRSWPPEGWVAPVTLPCGHMNHKGHGVTEDDPKQVAARAEGFCCAAAKQNAQQVARLNPGTSGRNVHLHVNWRVRGLTHPVPKALRRSPEREASGGFPGLCCDPESGLYIGGLGNNCRHYHTGSERCVIHAPKEVK